MYFVIHVPELGKHRLSSIQIRILHTWVSAQSFPSRVLVVTVDNHSAHLLVIYTSRLRVAQHLSIIHLRADASQGTRKQCDAVPTLGVEYELSHLLFTQMRPSNRTHARMS